MRLFWLLWGLIVGLLPLAVGVVGTEFDPHGWPSVLPWLTIITLPVGFLGGLFLMLVS